VLACGDDALSNAAQNFTISLSDNTRSRARISFRSTRRQGFSFNPPISSLMAHENIRDAAASTWLATEGVQCAMTRLTSSRLMVLTAR
jgi:hypothetical protein